MELSNSSKSLKELAIQNQEKIEIQIGYNQKECPCRIWRVNPIDSVQPIVKQTHKGLNEFYSSLYILSNKLDNQMSFQGLVREMSKNNTAFVYALCKVLKKMDLFLTDRIALIEGFMKLFFQILSKSQRTGDFIRSNRHRVFEFSRGIFSALVKASTDDSAPSSWANRQKFVTENFVCPYSGGAVIKDLVGLKQGSSFMICERSKAEQKIVQARQETTSIPILAELPELRHILSHFYRLEKPNNFIYWEGSYNPISDGIDKLASTFKLPDDIESIQTQSFMIDSLQLKTAVTFQGYTQSPNLFFYKGRIMIYDGMEPCSHNTLSVLDLQRREVYSLDASKIIVHNMSEEVKDEIVISREPDEAIVVLFDASKSMATCFQRSSLQSNAQKLSRLMATKSFFKAFADRSQAYNFRHVLSLVIFNKSIQVRCNFTQFFKSFKYHVDKTTSSTGTHLYDALQKALEMLNSFALEKYPRVLKRIVCLTDGEDVGSSIPPLTVLKNLINSNILVDSFIAGGRSEVLKCVSFATGGSCFYPKSVIQGIQLFQAETVLKASIRTKSNLKIDLEEEKLDSLKKLIDHFHDKNYTEEPQEMKKPEQLAAKSTSSRKTLKKVKKSSPPPSVSQNPQNLLKMKRIFRELHNLDKDPHPDVRVYPSEENSLFWNLLFKGPEGTPYSGYIFQAYATFPDEYPRQPPIFRFITPIYHCNINNDGRICHSIFDRNYSPSVTIREIMNHIFALLMTPEPKDPLDNKRAQEFFSNRDIYNSNVRKCCETYAFSSIAQAEDLLLGKDQIQEEHDQVDYPDQCLCSITKRLIKHPAYLRVDDKNYELEEIKKYVSIHKKSPVTGAPASQKDIVETPMLLKIIEKFKNQSTWFTEEN